jgi:hypothetical protein
LQQFSAGSALSNNRLQRTGCASGLAIIEGGGRPDSGTQRPRESREESISSLQLTASSALQLSFGSLLA